MFEQQPILAGRISIQDEAMDVARCAPQGAHCHADVIYLPLLTGIKEGSKCFMVLRVKPTLTRFPTNNLYSSKVNTLMHSVSSVSHPWGRSSSSSIKLTFLVDGVTHLQ